MTSYTYDFLLERFYEKMKEKTGNENKKKFSIKRPQIENINKSTIVKNFEDLCKILNRSENHLKSFLEKELNVQTSIDANNILIFDKRVLQIQIEDAINKYAKTFVICGEAECRSGDTEIVKENRISYLVCKSCCSRKAISE